MEITGKWLNDVVPQNGDTTRRCCGSFVKNTVGNANEAFPKTAGFAVVTDGGTERQNDCFRIVGGRPGEAGARARWANKPTLADKLRAGVDASGGPDACWPWRGNVDQHGYGQVWADYRSHLAHRVALEMKLGRPLRRNEVSRHSDKCAGNRLCCNPWHLQPGTVGQNHEDTVARGGRDHLRGEGNPAHILTGEQVSEIRRLAATMGYGRYELLGRRFGVTGKTISNIVRGLKWRSPRAQEAA